MTKPPLVSVNIRTLNSEKTLQAALESIRKQTYKNIEIVVSDGHSKDKTVAIAKKYGAKIHYIDKLGDARHEDYAISKGVYIFCLDSDQVASPGLIKTCVDMCEYNKVDVIIISERALIQKGTLLENLLAYDKWVIDQNPDKSAFFGTMFPRFFRKSVIDQVVWPKGLGMFDDVILYSKLLELGAQVEYLGTEHIGHHEVTDWHVYLKKWFRYGKGYYGALKEKPPTVLTHTLPRRVYFSRASFTKPHYLLGLFFLYVVKCTAAGFGVITSVAYSKK
jgi:glycosyltransferase involved in cell wall biosynthesis